ncbi:hypothetical protein N7462_001198 [Penicillium macrosclerotiorum]|uniref:uncharacterized protein n=1 Tax=Penicillium macrosclerotiorum TaxID=303699 RepID=UPI002547B825|nr:uncharacterized protein N7462_001198 [Penicillium macrosclerotiorum]KAJ5691775.1 hypothetical protein N7462_001198 [Penicillium macrosclerotiorum]
MSTSDQKDNQDGLPPYFPSESSRYFTEEKSEQLLLLPESNEPGLAVDNTLTRGLQVPSRTATCTSGFDYPAELIQYGISQEHWQQFTQVICDEAKLSRQQWTTVIGKGLGTLAVGGLMIGLLGAIPAIFVARNARKRQEQRNLITSMAGVQGERLSRHIWHWNETVFQPRGIQIRVDLPDEYIGDLNSMDLHGNKASPRLEAKARDKAALKARVVIIPLDLRPATSDQSPNTGRKGSLDRRV